MPTSKRKRKFAQDFSGESKTQQQFADTSNVNNIIRKYAEMGGELPEPDPSQFGYQASETFAEQMQKVAAVRTAFNELPAAVRASHGNDPSRWLDQHLRPTPQKEAKTPPEASEEALSSPDSDTTPDRDSDETVIT